MSTLTKRQTAFYLIFLVIVWGINWPLSKIALDDSPPLLFAALRTFIGGILLCFIAFRNRASLNMAKNWRAYTIAGVLNIALYYGIQTIGLGSMPAGLFSAIVFLQPVLLGICSWLWLGESMNPVKLAGLALGFCGVAVISIDGLRTGLSGIGIVLALITAVCWTLGTVYIKKIGPSVDTIWMTAMQLLIGGTLLFIGGFSTESPSAIRWEPSFIANLLFISIFVIAAGWLVFYKLVQSGEASKVGSFTFMIPLLAVVFSSFMTGEHITIRLVEGMVLVLFSILLVNIQVRKKKELNPEEV